jgi:small subunit ribosomal protein S18
MIFRSKKPKRGAIKVDCYFCKKKLSPDYKEVATLSRFISDRGKILSRDKTSLCQKHQSRVAQAIKRSRHLALLPFA